MNKPKSTSASPRVTVVGSSNTDMVVTLDRLPLPGETLLGNQFIMAHGGKGANQAVAAARLGANVTFIARLGDDLFGREALANFQQKGIDTSFITFDPSTPSGIALIFVNRTGENCIAVAPGANFCLMPEDIERARTAIAASSVLVVQLEIPLMTVSYAVELAAQSGVKVVLNPAPISEPLPARLLEHVDVLLPNETEARTLLKLSDDNPIDESVALRLLDLGVRSAIVTLGAKGALVTVNEHAELVPAPKVTAVDTTAAGDAFTGAIAVALASGSNLLEATHFAVRAAAISVTRMGAQPSLPTADEL